MIAKPVFLVWKLGSHSPFLPTFPFNPFREEKNKQEYGLWLYVDRKFHEDSELLLNFKQEESGKISHINHNNASSLEKSLPSCPIHGVVAPDDGKCRAGHHHFALLSPRTPAFVTVRRVPATASNWTKKAAQGMKRKLDFEKCDG